jgi:hypothetical protein
MISVFCYLTDVFLRLDLLILECVNEFTHKAHHVLKFHIDLFKVLIEFLVQTRFIGWLIFIILLWPFILVLLHSHILNSNWLYKGSKLVTESQFLKQVEFLIFKLLN